MQLEALVDNLDPDKAGQQTFLGRHDLPLPLILTLALTPPLGPLQVQVHRQAYVQMEASFYR